VDDRYIFFFFFFPAAASSAGDLVEEDVDLQLGAVEGRLERDV
jgi:hypothetical protein